MLFLYILNLFRIKVSTEWRDNPQRIQTATYKFDDKNLTNADKALLYSNYSSLLDGHNLIISFRLDFNTYILTISWKGNRVLIDDKSNVNPLNPNGELNVTTSLKLWSTSISNYDITINFKGSNFPTINLNMIRNIGVSYLYNNSQTPHQHRNTISTTIT